MINSRFCCTDTCIDIYASLVVIKPITHFSHNFRFSMNLKIKSRSLNSNQLLSLSHMIYQYKFGDFSAYWLKRYHGYKELSHRRRPDSETNRIRPETNMPPLTFGGAGMGT